MGVLELVRKLPYDHPYRWDGRTFGKPKLWTPSEISLAAWYDAYDLSTIISSGGFVSQWNDKSGNGNHVSQGTGSKQPSTGSSIGGLNALSFDGTADVLRNMSLSSPITGTERIALAVVQRTAGGTGNPRVLSVSSTGLSDWNNAQSFNLISVGAGTTLRTECNSLQSNYADGLPESTPVIAGVLFSGTDGQAISNGVLGDATTFNHNFSAEELSIGAPTYAEASFWKGLIAEVIVVAASDTATRQKIEGYLAWKWSLEANLPVGHPYKSTPPVV